MCLASIGFLESKAFSPQKHQQEVKVILPGSKRACFTSRIISPHFDKFAFQLGEFLSVFGFTTVLAEEAGK